MRLHLGLFASLSLVLAPWGCSDAELDVGQTGGSTSVGGGSTNSGGSGGDIPTGGSGNAGALGGQGGIPLPTEISECQGHIYECGDLIDNDMDGLLDAQDPDCLGPCDNTEDSFFGGIPGQAGPACKVDCYFDQDSGAGNDDCYWDHQCDPLSVAPNYYPEPNHGDSCEFDGSNPTIPPTGQTCSALNAEQSAACHDYCGPLTPNGCDCFGCCELPTGGGEYVWLGSEGADETTVCTMAQIDNPAICHPCTPVADCLNDCAPCEICIGKPTPDPGCGGGGGNDGQCVSGEAACGLPGQAACRPGLYCISGCCQEVPS